MAITTADILKLNPKIMADGILSATLITGEFYNQVLVKKYNRSDMKVGLSLTIATRGNLGLLQVKPEGVAMAEDSFAANTIIITPKNRALSVNFTAEAKNMFYGDLQSTVIEEMKISLAGTLDDVSFTTINASATVAIDDSTNTINLDKISEAIAAIGYGSGEGLNLAISTTQAHQVRTMKDSDGKYIFVPALNISNGVIGSIYGIDVIVSKKIVPALGKVRNLLIEDQALGMVFADGETISITFDTNNKAMVDSVNGNAVFEAFLEPFKQVQPILFKE